MVDPKVNSDPTAIATATSIDLETGHQNQTVSGKENATNHSPKNPFNLPPFRQRFWEITELYAKYSVTSFGGPNLHVAMLHDDLVEKRKWVSTQQFAELFAITQSLPGPGSTELAYGLALIRSGFLCALWAFLLWSIPAGIAMTVAGSLIGGLEGDLPVWSVRLEQGLASAAIGLVALAAYRMSTTLATDKLTRTLSLIAGSVTCMYTAAWLLPVVMISGGLVSFTHDKFIANYLDARASRKLAKKSDAVPPSTPLRDEKSEVQAEEELGSSGSDTSSLRKRTAVSSSSTTPQIIGQSGHAEELDHPSDTRVPITSTTTATIDLSDIAADHEKEADRDDDDEINRSLERKAFTYPKKVGLIFFVLFIVLLIASIIVRAAVPTTNVATYGTLFSTFYFVGSIIFGGGAVIIPLLRTYTVDSGWMTDQQFLVGFALIQCMPGPNFNFAAFLGAVCMANAKQSPVVGAILSFIAIFVPGLLLKNATIPVWQSVRDHPSVKMIFRGVNACALGLVFAAVWLLWSQTIHLGGSDKYHAVIASVAFVGAGYLNIPAPFAILIGGAMGAIEYAVSL